MKRWTLAAMGLVLLLTIGVMAMDIPNPLKNAKVGDWALMEMQGGIQQKQTVLKITVDAVTVKMDTIMNGKLINSMEMDLPLKGKGSAEAAMAPEDGPEPKIGSETVTLNGKELKCTTYEVTSEHGTTKTWICSDIPINGMVKSETDGTVNLKLVDWGHGK